MIRRNAGPILQVAIVLIAAGVTLTAIGGVCGPPACVILLVAAALVGAVSWSME